MIIRVIHGNSYNNNWFNWYLKNNRILVNNSENIYHRIETYSEFSEVFVYRDLHELP